MRTLLFIVAILAFGCKDTVSVQAEYDKVTKEQIKAEKSIGIWQETLEQAKRLKVDEKDPQEIILISRNIDSFSAANQQLLKRKEELAKELFQ